MKTGSVLKDIFIINYISYIRFNGKSDEYHIDLTLKTLGKYELDANKRIIKETDILSRKSKGIYLKSTAYYYSNLYKLTGNNFFAENDLQIKVQNDFNLLIYLHEEYKHFGKNNAVDFKSSDIENFSSESGHKNVLIRLFKYRFDKTEENTLINSIKREINENIENFIVKNSFEEGSNNGSSHEFGYWLNYVLDFYDWTKNHELSKELKGLFEKLHLIFVKRKLYFHDVIGKDKSLINISGLLLISKAMLRYTQITKDLRYANAAFFAIDIVKKLQLNNKGFLQNTLPIYKGNSKMKFPSWVLNYFLEILILKKQVLNEFKSGSNH